MSFTVLVPQEKQVVEVLFMGDKENCRRIVMEKMKKPFEWMNVKYGQNLQPWECTIKFDNIEGSDCGQFKSSVDATLHYYYVMNFRDGSSIIEKDPKRSCILMDPSKYKGQLGFHGNILWLNID